MRKRVPEEKVLFMVRRRTSSRRKSNGVQFVFAVSPQGRCIHDMAEVPQLPLPRKVVVSEDVLHVDGWHICVWPIWRETMCWLANQAGRWAKDDPSPENKAQVTGIIDAIETMVTRKAQEDDPKQGEFKF